MLKNSSLLPKLAKENNFEYNEPYNLSTQLKSWMAINPVYGCFWDCSYCIQEKDEFFNGLGKKLIKTATTEDVVTEIMINPRIKSKTPLTFFNFSDPFFPQNASMLKEILKGLDKRRFTNPVGLITKTYADEETLDMIADLKNLRTIVFVSYAGYTNKSLENAPNSRRIKLIKNMKVKNIKNMLYMRPLVKEWMEEGQMKRVRDEVGDYIDGVVMSGLRLTPEIAEKLEKKGIVVPKVKNFTNKYFPEELQQEVIDTFRGTAPVFRYTSCGMSALLGIPDYNAHLGFIKMTKGNDYHTCPFPCNERQNKICDSVQVPDDKKIRELINVVAPNLEYRVENRAILLNAELSKKDLTFIRHNTNTHVDYDNNSHHIDQIIGAGIK